MTREEFEAALDAGVLQTLETHSSGDRWYSVRRNGKVRVWKRDLTRFSIPIKYKLKEALRVDDRNFWRGEVDRWFRIKPGAKRAICLVCAKDLKSYLPEGTIGIVCFACDQKELNRVAPTNT